jgi:hypothetical protein
MNMNLNDNLNFFFSSLTLILDVQMEYRSVPYITVVDELLVMEEP